MEDELNSREFSNRVFGRDITNSEHPPRQPVYQKLQPEGPKNWRRAKPQREVYKPLTNRVPVFSSKTLNQGSNPMNIIYEEVKEEVIVVKEVPRRAKGERQPRSQRNSNFQNEAHSHHESPTNSSPHINPIFDEAKPLAIDVMAEEYPQAEEMLTEPDNIFSFETQMNFPGSHFTDAMNLPMRHIWSHLIFTKVAIHH